MRFLVALAVCLAAATVPLNAQEQHVPAKATGAGPRGSAAQPPNIVPKVAPLKPVVQPPKPEAVKPVAGKPPAQVPRSLEAAAEAIAAALAARAGAPRPARVMGGGAAAPARPGPRYRGPRYHVRWPDLHWDVQWPAASDRLALDWPEAPAESTN